ncbi:MAG: hypothetical protein IJW93_06795 [Clostridia bacterium]|nr:hypothetical protein [Clostridia bacterium]
MSRTSASCKTLKWSNLSGGFSNTLMPKVWKGETVSNGNYIWSDGTNMYCSYYSYQYVLNGDTWEAKTWNGFTPQEASSIWTDGTNIYYSTQSGNQYVLNGDTWEAKAWNYTSFYGHNVWTDGTNIYITENATTYVLNKETDTWEEKTFNNSDNISAGQYIWSKGENIYYSFGTDQYVLNKETDTWEEKTWNEDCSANGAYIFTDGENVYYSNGTNTTYVLNGDTWEEKEFVGGSILNAVNVWTDGVNIYTTAGDTGLVNSNLILLPTTARHYVKQGEWVEVGGIGEQHSKYDGTIIIEDALTLAGFTGLTNQSGELTLTDSIAEVATYSTATSGTAVTVSNDLDNYFPYNQITEFTDADGNVFVKFPKMYIKWVLDADGNIDGWQVSDKEFEGSFIPDCYLNSDGVSYNDYFAISKYSMSGTKDKGYSVSGQAPLVSITRAEARAAARAYGTADNYYGGYQIMDMSMVTVYNFLCMMYYRTSNIQSVFAGRVNHDSAIATGGTDAISGMNGWDTETGATKMLGVENYYCNVAHWIDGVTFVNGLAYLPRLPQNYSDTTDNCVASEVVLPVATSAPYWSKHLQAGTTAGTQSYVFQSDYAAEYDNTDVWENQYSCDPFMYYNAGDTPAVLIGGGLWDFGSLAGLWLLFAVYDASGSISNVGARLSYRPL